MIKTGATAPSTKTPARDLSPGLQHLLNHLTQHIRIKIGGGTPPDVDERQEPDCALANQVGRSSNPIRTLKPLGT
jgi:hypothetical protein